MTPLAAPALSATPPAPEKAKLAAAAKQFEAIFVRQMLNAARKADFGAPLLGGQAMDTFRQMQDERLADIAAERGSFGIAKMLEAQLNQSPSRRREGLGVGESNPALTHPQPLPPAGGEFVSRALPGKGD